MCTLGDLEACEAVDRIMIKREFGDAGATVVIEERLKGREASVLALVDGRTIYTLEPCQDHKRLGDGDTGPNTGGMGVFCPGGITDERMLARVEREVMVPILDVMRRDGAKIAAALEGHSWTAEPTQGRPVTIRFNPQRTEATLEPRWQPALRAAA